MTKVLVADDSSTMRAIIVNTLRDMGVTDIVEAVDGSEAEAMFQQDEFDLIVLDWVMPVRTGLDVLRSIRDRDAEVPVIMVTAAGSDRSQVLEATEAGATDYLLKPFHSATLRKKLEKFCQPATAGKTAG